MKISTLSFLFFFFGSLLFVSHSSAQLLRLGGKSNFQDSLNLVLAGYGNNFWSIQGAPIDLQGDPITYQSRISLPGSPGAVISRYRSVEDTSASWQTTVFESEDFSSAAKAYRKLVQDVKAAKLRFLAGPAQFKGELERADETLRFTTTGLQLQTRDLQYKNLHADISLLGDMTGWSVQISFYRRKYKSED